MGILFLTKEARIVNGAKTASSINGAGKSVQINTGEGMEIKESTYIVDGTVKWYSHCAEQYEGS